MGNGNAYGSPILEKRNDTGRIQAEVAVSPGEHSVNVAIILVNAALPAGAQDLIDGELHPFVCVSFTAALSTSFPWNITPTILWEAT